jgi:hypothetical protein
MEAPLGRVGLLFAPKKAARCCLRGGCPSLSRFLRRLGMFEDVQQSQRPHDRPQHPLRMPRGLKRYQQTRQLHFITFSCYHRTVPQVRVRPLDAKLGGPGPRKPKRDRSVESHVSKGAKRGAPGGKRSRFLRLPCARHRNNNGWSSPESERAPPSLRKKCGRLGYP